MPRSKTPRFLAKVGLATLAWRQADMLQRAHSMRSVILRLLDAGLAPDVPLDVAIALRQSNLCGLMMADRLDLFTSLPARPRSASLWLDTFELL